MRILVYFREHRFGGVHTYLMSQVAFLLSKGHTVWVSYANEKTRDIFKDLGARTFHNKELTRSVYRIDRDFVAIVRMYHFCKDQQVDCIFSHTSKGGAVARIAGFIAQTPRRIHVIHGFSFHEHSKVIEKIAGKLAEKFLSSLATKLISVNSADKMMAIKHRICPPWKIKTIKNGIQFPYKKNLLSDREKHIFLKANGFSSDQIIILFVGRLMKQKNPHYLLKAFARIDHPKANLVYIGEGPLKEELQQVICAKNLNHRIHLLGFRQDVYAWYQVCSLFVLPSLWEGLPMTLLEAMAVGACCVATNIKGNRECIAHDHDGLLTPCNDDLALSNTITALLFDPALRSRLGNAARHKVATEFSVERMCEMTHRILCHESG